MDAAVKMYDAKTALVLGLGESELAMALWLARSGASVRVADTRQAPERPGGDGQGQRPQDDDELERDVVRDDVR